MNATSKKAKLLSKLKDKEYRDAYVEANIANGIAYQIRATREARGWTQHDLAERAHTKQNAISRLENPNYGKFSIQTLLELASALDVALLVKFVPYSKLLEELSDLSPEALAAKGFEEELPTLEWRAGSNSLSNKPVAATKKVDLPLTEGLYHKVSSMAEQESIPLEQFLTTAAAEKVEFLEHFGWLKKQQLPAGTSKQGTASTLGKFSLDIAQTEHGHG